MRKYIRKEVATGGKFCFFLDCEKYPAPQRPCNAMNNFMRDGEILKCILENSCESQRLKYVKDTT